MSDDDIPVIPDLDDIRDELILNEMVEAPTVSVNRVATYKELNSDLLKQGAFAALEDVDLSILAKCLQSEMVLNEPDEVWTWEKLFTDISAEIHSEKPQSATERRISGAEVMTKYVEWKRRPVSTQHDSIFYDYEIRSRPFYYISLAHK